MNRLETLAKESSALLAQLDHELHRISTVQHELARRKVVLQQQATRLRLGASPAEVSAVLETAMQTSPELL